MRVPLYSMLKKIGRTTTGADYRAIRKSIKRLAATVIETSIGPTETGPTEIFHWLEQGSLPELKPKDARVILTLPDWLYNAVVKERRILAVPPEYFSLTGGIERFMWRVSRRHGGNTKTQPGGWRMTMKELWDRSGSSDRKPNFALTVRRIVRENKLPGYDLSCFRGSSGDEIVTMIPKATSIRDRRLRDIKLPD